jgi:ADP-ribosylation factor GTPase-activating protein 2/3
MGVHTTFVRSVDLDEWTQRQIDAMKLGGNDNARKYFRKNGVEMHVKIDKKYKSKAAQMYRQELEKLVAAEAAKRGDGVAVAAEAAVTASSLLENLSLVEQQQTEQAAKERLAAARAGAISSAPAQASAKTAAEMHGKGLLITPPSSGNAPKIVLRAPGNITKNLLKKKASGSSMGSKLRVNKLGAGDEADADAGFDDEPEALDEPVVEATPVLPTKPVIATNGSSAALPVEAKPQVPISKPPLQHQGSMEAGVAKLQQMNTDFFSGL